MKKIACPYSDVLRESALANPHHRGDVIQYRPWLYEFGGMDEPARVAKGIFVLCHGHGEFDVLKARRAAHLNKEGQ